MSRLPFIKEDGWSWRTKCPFNTEFQVSIDINCIYDKVLFIHVEPLTPPPNPLNTKISFEKSNFLIFCAFLHILHVYDFFINVLFN